MDTLNKAQIQSRLESLDILRGLDLFFLVFLGPVLKPLLKLIDSPYTNPILEQFNHVKWQGFSVWDFIMPLFLFMVGAAMPFAFEKYRAIPDKSAIYKKILKRFVLLYLLGMVVQGNLLWFEFNKLNLYSNTLQAIAVGYLFSAIIILNFSIRGQIISIIALLLAYWIPITFCGDFTPEGNFANKLDKLVLGQFRDGIIWTNDGSWKFSPRYHYTWILSSLTFVVTVMLGSIAGKLMKDDTARSAKTARKLTIIGATLISIGLLWNLQTPIIKKIWSCSMTLFSGGLCFILMSIFYFLVDCKKYTRGLRWLKIYGMNSITAYLLGSIINFRSIVESVSYGLKPIFGDQYYALWLTFGNFLIIFFILQYMHKQKIFLKL